MKAIIDTLMRLGSLGFTSLLLVALAPRLDARAELLKLIRTEPGVRITVSSILEHTPQDGILPLRVEIKNDFNEELSWKLQANINGWRSPQTRNEATMRVAARSTKVFTVNVDSIAGTENNSNYRNITYFISGPGVENFASSLENITSPPGTGYGTPRKKYGPVGLFSRELDPFSTYLANTLKSTEYSYGKKKEEKEDMSWLGPSELLVFYGDNSPIELYPSRWQEYTSVQQIWLTAKEFSELKSSQRDAIYAWVHQGGILFRVGERITKAQRKSFTALFGNEHWKRHRGLGLEVLISKDVGRLNITDYNFWLGPTDSIHNPLRSGIQTKSNESWKLQELIDQTAVLAGPVVLILLVYALLVGPVAILWFAVANNKPSSLYFSIPVLSIVTSLILVLTLIFQFGTGARGDRRLAVVLDPEKRKALVVQEQSTINGVLFNNRFTIPETAIIRPVFLKKKPADFDGLLFSERDGTFSGDYYRERSQTHHILEDIHTTRTRIEVNSSGAQPELISSLPITLRKVMYVDASGNVWRGENLSEGARVRMTLASADEKREFVSSLVDESGSAIAPIIRKLSAEKGYVFGVSDDASNYAIETLSKITWAKTPGVVLTPVLEGGIRK